MSAATTGPTYRFREFRSEPHFGKGYRHSIDVLDEASQDVLCTCHLAGNACFSKPQFLQGPQPPLQLDPDRSVMPSRWTLADANGRAIVAFARRSLASAFVNPLGRTILTVFDDKDAEIGQLVDPRSSAADRLMRTGPDEWRLVRGAEVLARLIRLPRKKAAPTTLLGRLADALTPSDRGLVSVGPAHALSAPAALAMLLLLQELGERST
jgi:hypothetical protein